MTAATQLAYGLSNRSEMKLIEIKRKHCQLQYMLAEVKDINVVA